MKTYIGIADAEGIETFHEWGAQTQKDLHMYSLRARFNNHRDATVYRITFLDISPVNKIKNLLENQKCKEALLVMKAFAAIVEVQKGNEKVWNRIPHLTQEDGEELIFERKKLESRDPCEIKQIDLPFDEKEV